MEFGQVIQALGQALTLLPAWPALCGLAVGLVEWRLLAGTGQAKRLPCAAVTTRRPIGKGAGQRW
jgi:hypothetical protein